MSTAYDYSITVEWWYSQENEKFQGTNAKNKLKEQPQS